VRFLLDQSSDARLIPHLRSLGHEATRIARDYPAGLPDSEVLAVAHREERILITDDRDFGELVFQHFHPHSGVIYLRLGDDADIATKRDRINHVLAFHVDQLDQFLVVTRDRVRNR
jgi:predicted nuclease of predicted toxin-antitoxin system